MQSGLGHRLRHLASTTITRGEILTVVRALPVAHPLGVRLATFVVGTGIVVLAVPAGVKVGGAAVAGIAETDALTGSDLDGLIACEATHGWQSGSFMKIPG